MSWSVWKQSTSIGLFPISHLGRKETLFGYCFWDKTCKSNSANIKNKKGW